MMCFTTESGRPLRKAAWPQVTGVCSADIYPLRAGVKILPRYLQYLLLSDEFTSFAVRISNRAGMPKVNREQLFAYEFHLPSLGEQAADVALLDKVYERLAELQRLAVVRKRELWALKRSLVFGASPREREWVPVGKYVEWVRATETVSSDVRYAFAGVKSFGGGVFESVSPVSGPASPAPGPAMRHRNRRAQMPPRPVSPPTPQRATLPPQATPGSRPARTDPCRGQD